MTKLGFATFDRSFEKWLGFYESFRNVIHRDEGLLDSSKLLHLFSCLKGEATGIIDSLQFSDGNFNEAWDLLIERLNNPQLIVQTHVRCLIELPTYENVQTLNEK